MGRCWFQGLWPKREGLRTFRELYGSSLLSASQEPLLKAKLIIRALCFQFSKTTSPVAGFALMMSYGHGLDVFCGNPIDDGEREPYQQEAPSQ